MDIIVVSHKRGRTWRIKLDPRHVLSWLPAAAAALLICLSAFGAGYLLRGDGSVLPEGLVSAWAHETSAQRQQLAQTRELAQDNAQVLSRHVAQLQARVMRLDAAGQRLTEIAGLEAGEFDFNNPPPMGGPEIEIAQDVAAGDPILLSLDTFERKLSDRERQLRVLEDLLLASRLQKEVAPSGWPVENGYISSTFGWRSDPFTGRKAMHQGIDFAAREGSDVLAAASGIVTDIGERFGYGKLVEINHGNGYVTRYGHNKTIVAKVGDRVYKGQRIAQIGSTGRSTGPHVHFEVLLNNQVVNPEQYIRAAR